MLGVLAGLMIGQARAETGLASFYGGPVHHGKPMANGRRFDQDSDSCAHKTLPFGTVLRVTTAAGRSVLCRVHDRGPFRKGRILDLSVAGARALHMIAAGIVRVRLEKVQ